MSQREILQAEGGESDTRYNQRDSYGEYVDYSNNFPYHTLTSKDVKTLTDTALERADQLIEQVVACSELTWESVVEPIVRMGDELCTAYAPLYITGRMHAYKKVRNAASKAEIRINQHDDDIWQRSDLYKKLKDYSVTEEAQALDGERARFLKLKLQSLEVYHELEPADRAKMQTLMSELIKNESQFVKNISEDRQEVVFEKRALKWVRKEFRQSLERTETGAYKVEANATNTSTILQESPVRSTRKKIHTAFRSIAAEANRPILEEMLEKRQRIARLLGRKSWAHYQLENCMLSTPEEVKVFYKPLIQGLESAAQAEVVAMEKLFHEDGHKGKIKQHDTLYYASKLQQSNEQTYQEHKTICRYFPVERVVENIFKEIIGELYGLEYKKLDQVPVWHEDVEVYGIYEGQTRVHTLYLDLFARPNKLNATYHLPIRMGRSLSGGEYRSSTSVISGDFSPPEESLPAVLTPEEIFELLHEMGHCIAQVQARTEIADFTLGDADGFFLALDYAELTAQVMEKWALEPEILHRLSGHYQSGKRLSIQHIERYLDSQEINNALSHLGRIALHCTDLALHDGSQGTDIDEAMREMGRMTKVPHDEETFPLATFTHLVDYSARCSVYDVSDMIAHDIYENRFKPAGLTNRKIGREFVDKLLRPSGSVNGWELAKNMLGREPDPAAYLAKLGVTTD